MAHRREAEGQSIDVRSSPAAAYDAPMPKTHAQVLRAVRDEAKAADREAIAGAFVASLGEAPGFWRAPLCALAAAEAVAAHRYRPFSAQSPDCRECGLTPHVDAAEIHERGQILPGDLAAAYAVLVRARELTPPRADRAAARRLARVLALVGELPAAAREGKLADAIRAERLIAGNRYDIRSVIETLGACGILQTPEHPGFTTRWTSFAARQDRPSSRVECDPPIAFWTSGHGVEAENVARWFGAHGVKAPKAAGPRASVVASASRSANARAKRAARATELEPGDVVALSDGKQWGAVVVVDHHHDMSGRVPIVEMLDWRGKAPPSLASLKGRPAAGARGVRDRVAIDLWVRDDPRGRWRTLGGGMPAPDASHLAIGIGRYSFSSVGKDGAGLAALLARARRK